MTIIQRFIISKKNVGMFSTTKNISPWSYGIVKWNEYTPAIAYEHIIV